MKSSSGASRSPGPGLAIRVLGEVTRERLEILREADAVLLEEIRKNGYYRKLWQSFAVLLPIKSVGVMGDQRTYENILAIRAVTSKDAMTGRLGEAAPWNFWGSSPIESSTR